jgi:hypothetical protein
MKPVFAPLITARFFNLRRSFPAARFPLDERAPV